MVPRRAWDASFTTSGGMALLAAKLPAQACGDPTYAALVELLLLPDKHKVKKKSESRHGQATLCHRLCLTLAAAQARNQ